MTNATTQTEPAHPGESDSSVSQRSLVARRRRVFVLVVLAAVVAVAIAANYGPVQSYLDARSRLDKVAAKVAALEQQKAELQSRLGKLTEAEYLETLAREDLTYSRSGEDVYIITGGPTDVPAAEPGTETDEATGADAGALNDGNATDGPGPLERLLTRFLDLF